MKKLFTPLALTIFFYASFFCIIDLKPYLTGPIPPVAESGGIIPLNLWFSIGLETFSFLFIIAALICQVWIGARVSMWLDERREKAKKNGTGI